MKRMYNHLSVTIIVALALVAGYELYTQSWSDLFMVGQAIVLSTVPYILQKKYDIYTPELVRLGIIGFLFASLVLGEVSQFYLSYFWWDTALHAFAGTGSTLIAFILLVITYRKSELRSTPFMTTLLAFSLTMTMAVVWEVYEFMVDIVWKPEMPMQPDNADTMIDFIATIVGALLIVFPGYRYLAVRNANGVIPATIEAGRRENN